MKRYYEYILRRIQNGLEPLNNITADFTGDEASKLYQMMSKSVGAVSTEDAMREYIKVINEESQKLSKDDVVSMSADDLQAYLDRIRKNKQ